MLLPAWNIESEYPSISSVEFAKDELRFISITREMVETISLLRPQLDLDSVDLNLIKSLQNILPSLQIKILNKNDY